MSMYVCLCVVTMIRVSMFIKCVCDVYVCVFVCRNYDEHHQVSTVGLEA